MREYFRTHNRVFQHNITSSELLVLIYLYRCQNKGIAFPSYTTIARNCHISQRTAITAIKGLEKKGIISVERQGRKSNRYAIIA